MGNGAGVAEAGARIVRRVASACGRARITGERLRHGDDGFSLIELLVVLVIMPLVVGAITIGVVATAGMLTNTNQRVAGSVDAQLTSAYFVRDVASATALTTQSSSSPRCGSGGTQLLGLQWNAGQTVISYVEVTSGPQYSLVRRQCALQSGSLNLSSSETVAGNIPAAEPAPAVTCAVTATSCNASSGWITTAGVSGVALSVNEPSTGYSFALSAVPRSWTPRSGGVPGGGTPVLPLELLGSGSPVFTASGSASLTVGGGSGVIGVASTSAASVQLSGSAVLSAASVSTADSSLNSVSLAGGAQGPATETYATGGLSNPLASLVAPANPSTSATGSCPAGSPLQGVCTPGNYAVSPLLGSGADVTFGSGSGTFVFTSPVTISSNAVVVFKSGTYWFEGGLTIEGQASVVFDTGTYIFGSTAQQTSTALDVTAGASVTSGAGGELLYIEAGAATFDGGTTVSLSAQAGNDGVAIWDAAASGATYPLTLGGGGVISSSYGGIYVPNGQVYLSGGGVASASFVVAATAVAGGTSIVQVG